MTDVRIGRAVDVPDLEGRSVTVAGRRIAVFHTGERFHALDAACPHAGGPLADGLVTESCVTCPLHGRRFDLRSGECAGGEPGVRSYEVVEHGGELWLRLPARDLSRAA